MRAQFIDTPAMARLRSTGRLEVGAHTYGSPDLRWWGEDARLRIGSFCSIAADVTIFLGGNHRPDWVTTYPFSEFEDWPEVAGRPGHPATNGDVVIGHDVWIGDGASIMSGVTIGHGAVVGARALVTRDVEPYAIVGGSPARLIRHRFEPHLVEQLLQLAWWDWPDERLRAALPVLLSGDVEGLLAQRPHTAPGRGFGRRLRPRSQRSRRPIG